MKWVYVKSTATVDHYTLLKDDSPFLQLKYNHHTDTARVNYNEEKRAFMIQPNDEIKNRICLQNEYGFDLGYLAYDHLSEYEGLVQMEDKKYRFKAEPGISAKLLVYQESSIAPLVSYEISGNTLNNRLFEKSPLQAALLLVLCWCLYLPVKNKAAVLEL